MCWPLERTLQLPHHRPSPPTPLPGCPTGPLHQSLAMTNQVYRIQAYIMKMKRFLCHLPMTIITHSPYEPYSARFAYGCYLGSRFPMHLIGGYLNPLALTTRSRLTKRSRRRTRVVVLVSRQEEEKENNQRTTRRIRRRRVKIRLVRILISIKLG